MRGLGHGGILPCFGVFDTGLRPDYSNKRFRPGVRGACMRVQSMPESKAGLKTGAVLGRQVRHLA